MPMPKIKLFEVFSFPPGLYCLVLRRNSIDRLHLLGYNKALRLILPRREWRLVGHCEFHKSSSQGKSSQRFKRHRVRASTVKWRLLHPMKAPADQQKLVPLDELELHVDSMFVHLAIQD